MKSNEIKQVFRFGLPETNSSSSHSVVINRYSISNITADDVPVDENGNLVLPKGVIFSSDRRFFNDIKNKLLYTCGLIYNRYSIEESKEKLKELAETIKNFTGINDVIFEWVGCEEDYLSYPYIDHESLELTNIVLSSKESMLNFIFNKKSWLIIEHDSDCMNLRDYDKTIDQVQSEENKAYCTLKFGGEIGDVNFELNPYPVRDIVGSLLDRYYNEKDLAIKIIESIVVDKGEVRAITEEDIDFMSEDIINENDPRYESLYFFLNYKDLYVHGGVNLNLLKTTIGDEWPCLLYINRKLGKELYELIDRNGDKSDILHKLVEEFFARNYKNIYKVKIEIVSNCYGKLS